MTKPGDSFQIPATSPVDSGDPLLNLSNLRSKMDSLHHSLSHSPLSQPHLDSISGEIATVLRHVINNATALISTSFNNPFRHLDQSAELETKSVSKDWDIVEIDSVEILTEHVHFCEICRKGFKRDANLRMHMRAHGDRFKTSSFLAKDNKNTTRNETNTRFSCPYVGCIRNKNHEKFRPLKSAVCVKNHFKRSHCPKMYSCNRCNGKKSFSVLADLKSHLKHCGKAKWKCSCGTTFSRKDKLFGHMALFEGHMPAVVEEEKRVHLAVMIGDDDDDDDDENKESEKGEGSFSDSGFLDGLLDGYDDTIDGYNLQDVLGMGSPSGFDTPLDEFFKF